MRKFDTKQLTLAAVIAAAYAALTLCLPAYGAIQVRLSEAFTVLPFLFPGGGARRGRGVSGGQSAQPLRAHRRGVRHRRHPAGRPVDIPDPA